MFPRSVSGSGKESRATSHLAFLLYFYYVRILPAEQELSFFSFAKHISHVLYVFYAFGGERERFEYGTCVTLLTRWVLPRSGIGEEIYYAVCFGARTVRSVCYSSNLFHVVYKIIVMVWVGGD